MPLTVLILVGGLSQRMGQDKALLEKDGVSLLQRTWDIAQVLTPNVWIVTSRRDRYQPLLPVTAQWLEETPPPLGQLPSGPLIAFLRALEQITAEWIMLLACDLPNLRVDVLTEWCTDLVTLPQSVIAYLPRTEEGWEPLCGFYRSSCLPSLQTYAATGQRSFQGWLDQAGALAIPSVAVPAEMLINCNTPADWERLQKS